MSTNYFDLAQEFIERSQSAASADELAKSFASAIATLGFRYFACCSHVDPLQPPRRAVVLHSYPMAWVRMFSEQGWFRVDPVFRHAERTLLPFFWDSSGFNAGLTRQQREILAEAGKFGIAHGYTVPIHVPCSRIAHPASCSFVPDLPFPDLPSHRAAQLMAYYMYDAASREADAREGGADLPIELSDRERQCLDLVAQGKSDWVVGKLLGISERTVHNHVERAKRRLRVSTRIQVIMHALATRQISFGDVIVVASPRPASESTSKKRRSRS